MPGLTFQRFGEGRLGGGIETGGEIGKAGFGAALVFDGDHGVASPPVASFVGDSFGAGIAPVQMRVHEERTPNSG
ncbi:hypothetical protein GCM10007874_58940 [Labrys miyagiensis]|uniref:Uncharacterized protein n=1 Tax=Labrys miyagiensis TaxID=346912 RepID=A0ABQ6CVY4_9HYPH|nr:hypothetical protein GCM10007874_58940 [Labrys miyagiensis]